MDLINVTEYQRGNSPENFVPQDDEKQHKNTMQYELDTTMRKQTQIT